MAAIMSGRYGTRFGFEFTPAPRAMMQMGTLMPQAQRRVGRKRSMKSSITRRDFLNGAALALAAGATLSPRDLLALESATAAAGRIG